MPSDLASDWWVNDESILYGNAEFMMESILSVMSS
jgi:hypothetical protein